MVILHNSTTKPFVIATGDRIAQIVFECAETPYIISTTTLPSTARGEKGFGSTKRQQSRRCHRKRGFIHTSNGIIFLDNTGEVPKGKRVSPPITTAER